MAIYSLPMAVSRIAGSRGGSTFQKAGTNFIIRKRSVIVQKRSSKQSIVKSLLASRAQFFRTLSAADQLTWSTNAPLFPRTDSLGNIYIMPGIALQILTNINAALLNDAPVSIASLPVVYPSRILDDVGFADVISFLEAIITDVSNPSDHTVPVGFSLKMFFTRPLSPGIISVPDFEYKLVQILSEGVDTFNLNFYPAYLLTLPPLEENTGNILYAAFKLTSIDNFIDDEFVFSPGQIL